MVCEMSKKNMICQECKAILLSPDEFHPYEYCLLAKAEPQNWRKFIGYIINNADKFERSIVSGNKLRGVKQ